MPRPVHFEIHAEDPDRCMLFYETLFQWQFAKWDGPMDYWLVTTGSDAEPGINGGLLRRPGPAAGSGAAVNAFVCTVSVPNIDQILALGEAFGAQVAVPKMPVPGIGWLAYLLDTESNIVGVMQSDATAA
jgi:uncharacterized protein